jgi:hypothetical protein
MPKAPLPPAEFDTIRQFAARCGVAVRTIYRAIDDGQIIVDYIGNTPRIDPVRNVARIVRGAVGRARMQCRDLSPAAGAVPVSAPPRGKPALVVRRVTR